MLSQEENILKVGTDSHSFFFLLCLLTMSKQRIRGHLKLNLADKRGPFMCLLLCATVSGSLCTRGAICEPFAVPFFFFRGQQKSGFNLCGSSRRWLPAC